uniref:Uncharacterized protein n=1 Tax=Kalanchoe fedtschenkoi TaxID=63787 RepID=A0A7N0TAT8_KALFE
MIFDEGIFSMRHFVAAVWSGKCGRGSYGYVILIHSYHSSLPLIVGDPFASPVASFDRDHSMVDRSTKSPKNEPPCSKSKHYLRPILQFCQVLISIQRCPSFNSKNMELQIQANLSDRCLQFDNSVAIIVSNFVVAAARRGF